MERTPSRRHSITAFNGDILSRDRRVNKTRSTTGSTYLAMALLIAQVHALAAPPYCMRRCISFMERTVTGMRAYVQARQVCQQCGGQLFGGGIIWVKMFSPVSPSEPCTERSRDGSFALLAVCQHPRASTGFSFQIRRCLETVITAELAQK